MQVRRVRPAGGGGTGSGGGISLGGTAAAGGWCDLRFFLVCGFDFGGVSDSADAACLKSVPFIAAGDSVRCESLPLPPPPPQCAPGFGENIAEAVMDMGGAGDPKDRFRSRGESSGGAVPLGLGEKMADAVIATGEVASPAAENGRNIFAAEPAFALGEGTHTSASRVFGAGERVGDNGGRRQLLPTMKPGRER